MRIFSANTTDDVVSSPYLGTQLLAFPEIKKKYIRQVCEELGLCLTNKVLGFGRAVNPEDYKKSNDKMFIAGPKIQWAVQPRIIKPFTVAATPVGNGAGGANITFYFDENWGQPGMVLKFDDQAGGFVNIVLTSTATPTSIYYSYTGKIVSSSSETFDSALAPVDRIVGWTGSISPYCSDTSTETPITTFDWYENYTTITKQSRVLCRDGLTQAMWIEGDNGSRCWQPVEEYQFFLQYMKGFEYLGWYGTTTVNSSGDVYITDASGNEIRTGDGIFPQVEGGNIVTWSVATYTNPANYATFLTLIKSTIENWSIINGIVQTDLDIWAGTKAFGLLNDVFIDYFNEAGGCCYIDYETGEEVKGGINVKTFHFASFNLNLKKCITFDNPNMHGYKLSGSSIPYESYKFVIMPDTACDGQPLIQVYFRGGCGIESAFIHKIIPGTIDPRDPNGQGGIAVNKYDGYEMMYVSEFTFILNDPSKLLVFSPIA